MYTYSKFSDYEHALHAAEKAIRGAVKCSKFKENMTMHSPEFRKRCFMSALVDFYLKTFSTETLSTVYNQIYMGVDMEKESHLDFY